MKLKKELLLDFLMGLQYLFVAAGATILVPLITGLPVSVCLFTAGVGTLIFHLVTKGKVPVLLSSSFAFIAPIMLVKQLYGIQAAFGGIIVAGLLYIALAVLIYFVGIKIIKKIFPPVITATMVILIGIILAPVAIANASAGWLIAFITLAAGVFFKLFFKEKFISSMSVIVAIIVGTLVALIFGQFDLTALSGKAFIALPEFMLPVFSWKAILIIAPIAFVTFLEHFADVSAVSKVVEKDFIADPGIHRTLIGDGIATAFAGLVGGVPNTTYSENIGALEMTGVKKPSVLRITAVMLIIFSLLPMLTSFLQSIPIAVIGGISILLFGLISANGIKSLAVEKIDFKDFRNLVIISAMLVIGTGGALISFGNLTFSSLALAALVGVLLNLGMNFKTIIKK